MWTTKDVLIWLQMKAITYFTKLHVKERQKNIVKQNKMKNDLTQTAKH